MARHPVMVDPRYGSPSGWDTVPLASRSSGMRPRLLALIGLCLVMAGWLAGLTSSARGWLAIGGAFALVIVLAFHHRDGGRRRLARVICEYATVALVVVLATTAAAGGSVDGTRQPPAARHQARSATANDAATAAGASAGQLASDARAWLAELWRQAWHNAGNPHAPTTTTTPSRKHRR
jgi:hypothetical protein